jgi:ABC-2 type transport system permease protein
METLNHIRTIIKREWNAYFNSPIAYVFIVIFLALAGFFTFSLSRFFEAGQADLRAFFIWLPWLFLILVPAAAMRLWAEERRSGTIELLLTLSVTNTQATIGKFLAAWFFLILALILTFPLVLTTFYLGSPDLGVIISGYVGGALLAGAFLGIGIFTSALTRNQVISFVISVIIGLLVILIGFPPVTEIFSRLAPGWLVNILAGFSVMPAFMPRSWILSIVAHKWGHASTCTVI